MSDQFHARPVVLLNETAITQNTTATGSWFNMPRAQAFNLWWYMTASGAPDVTIYLDYTIWKKGDVSVTSREPPTTTPSTFAPESTSRTNYRTITLASNQTTKAAWTHIDTPDEMKYPFSCCRVRVTENNVAAVTTFTFAMAIQGA